MLLYSCRDSLITRSVNLKSKPEFSNYANENYIKPFQKRRKREKKQKIENWFSQNWINLVTLIATVLTLVATILFGVIQLMR